MSYFCNSSCSTTANKSGYYASYYFKCVLCKSPFRSETLYTNHVLSCFVNKTNSCNICKLQLYNSDEAVDHTLNCHPPKFLRIVNEIKCTSSQTDIFEPRLQPTTMLSSSSSSLQPNSDSSSQVTNDSIKSNTIDELLTPNSN
ncbi:hypothetical protein GJ496_005596 [Pomphorhynchus laevis]|nr:hypothetical protein GJ496_005596 [Pomphorhynchus laevis]